MRDAAAADTAGRERRVQSTGFIHGLEDDLASFARARMLNRLQIRHHFLQQRNACRDLRAGHFSAPFGVFDKRIEYVAVLDFNPVAFIHDEACGSASACHDDTGPIEAVSQPRSQAIACDRVLRGRLWKTAL